MSKIAQPRHSKGTTSGGQWRSKPIAADADSESLQLTDTVQREPSCPPLRDKASIKLLSRQRTFHKKNGEWDLPIGLASRTARLLYKPLFNEPHVEEAIDAASVVVTEMMDDPYYQTLPNKAINKITRAAVSGAYNAAFYRQFGDPPVPGFLSEINALEPLKPTGEYNIPCMEACLRGMRVGQELGLYKNEEINTTKGYKQRVIYVWKTVPLLERLMPAMVPHPQYLGDDGLALHRLMSMDVPLPREQGPLIDFLLEGKARKHRRVSALTRMSLYLIGTTEPDDPMNGKALECLTALASHSDLDYRLRTRQEYRKVNMIARQSDNRYSKPYDLDLYRKIVDRVREARALAWPGL